MNKKKNTDNKIVFDNDIVLSSVMFDTVGAEKSGFLPTIKKRFNVAIIPAGHHIYTGELKVSGYKWLATKTGILSIVIHVSGKGISLYSGDVECLGKSFENPLYMKKNFAEDFNVSLCEDWFEKIEYDLPYPRILSDYREIFIFCVGKTTPKSVLENFFMELYILGNLVFISDLHSGLPLEECIKKDELTINGKNDIVAFNWFFSLAKSNKKKARFVGYVNSADINGNNKSTTGFCTMVF